MHTRRQLLRHGVLPAVSALAAAFMFGGSAEAATRNVPTRSHAPNPEVRFATSMGDFVVELYPDKAPRTVENFLRYVHEKHYDGTVFHRVIDNFMVQGGGYDTLLNEKTHPQKNVAKKKIQLTPKQKANPPPHCPGRPTGLHRRTAQHHRHPGHGTHQRPQFSSCTILHQREGQRHAGSSAHSPR